jgi:hypothetical protein
VLQILHWSTNIITLLTQILLHVCMGDNNDITGMFNSSEKTDKKH